MLTLFIDSLALPQEKQKELVLKACADVGANCDFVPQRVERTITWHADLNAPPQVKEEVGKETMVILSTEDAVYMIEEYVHRKQNAGGERLTLAEWVRSLQEELPQQNLSIFILGLRKYFSDQKLSAKQKYSEAVTGQPAKRKKKAAPIAITVEPNEAEEAFVEVQLFTGCVIQQAESDEEMANQIKLFTKAVSEKHNKKDRFNNVFSFLEEGASGLSVSKNGEGLSKVWKHQLMQFKNFGPEMAAAVQQVYPSPYLLHQACMNSGPNADSEKELAEINVRRNASIIATNRKIGKEHARRIHNFMTSSDPNQVVK